MHLTDTYYPQIDAVQAEYPTDKRDPAHEARHRRVRQDPEGALEARVARTDDQHRQQVDDPGPDKQAYRGDDRRENYGAYEPPEPDVPPDPDQLEQSREYGGHLVADDREDEGVYEVP